MGMLSLDRSAGMLATLGTRGFGQALMATGNEMIAADYCSLFVFDTGQEPICLSTNGTSSNRLAAYAAEKYTAEHWKADPTVIELNTRRHAEALLISGLPERHPSGSYWQDCFEALKIGDRITFLFGSGARFLRLSFYRYAAHPPFREAELTIARDATDFFRCATTRHHSLILRAGMDHPGSSPSPRAMRGRLLSLNSSLSQREVEVCALILRGVSTEGIALEIGVGKTSVMTYRKRAYAKLGISSQSQLFAACLSLNT